MNSFYIKNRIFDDVDDHDPDTRKKVEMSHEDKTLKKRNYFITKEEKEKVFYNLSFN